MKVFTFIGLMICLLLANPNFAQFQKDDPNLDQIPQYLRERASAATDASNATTAVITIDNWDNFSLGVDFAEGNIAENPAQPTWYFAAYNTNTAHHTENGIDWVTSTPNFGASMQGDPVQVYDSIGNLFYQNMYGSSIAGCKTIVSTNNGVAWGASQTSIAGNDKNWMACDQTSGPYANYSYQTMTRSGGGNFSRSTDHGLTWTNMFAPTTQTLPGMMVAVGAEGPVQGGAVYVVTNGGGSFNATYTFYKSVDGGATFVQKSSVQWANTVGSQVGGRNSVSNMRTRPYPMIAADNSYGANRGKFYCVYASNDPPGATSKSDVWCRSSSDGGATWSSAVRVNDDPNTINFQQWHPAIWCDKETGKLYAMWMDTRDCPTNDSALIYASYSVDGGATWAPNQQVSNKKFKIDCGSCGGGGTPRYEGDYNGIVSNKKVSMAAWTDFRSNNFQSMTGYFPDFAMAIDKSSDTLFSPMDNTTITVSIPGVRLYTDTVILSGVIAPAPTTGTITFEYPQGDKITTYPGSKPVKLVLNGAVPNGNYQATFYAKGPNGTPVHKRIATIRVLQGFVFLATVTATPNALCQGQTSQLNASITGGTAPFTYTWSPTTGLNNPNIANPVATPTATTYYKVVVNDNASHTTTDSVKITVNVPPAAPGPIVGMQTLCGADTATYTIDVVTGATTYSWTVPANATILSGQNTPSVTVIWGNTGGNLQVIAGNDCGPSAASVLPVTISMPPAAPTAITGPASLCATTTGTFTTSYTGGSVVYHWTVPADATIQSGQGTETINVLWGTNAGNVDVYLTNDCGTGPVVTKAVTVSTIPAAAGAITGQDTVCKGQGNYIYGVAAITGATTYEWTLPQGVTVTAGQGTNQVTLLMANNAQTGDLKVKGTNTCGSGGEATKTINQKNCTGIGQNDLNASVKIFPNPVKDELTVSITGNERSLDLTITDMNGKAIFSEKVNVTGSEFKRKLDVSGFASGVYFLRLTSGNRSYTEKVVVR